MHRPRSKPRVFPREFWLCVAFACLLVPVSWCAQGKYTHGYRGLLEDIADKNPDEPMSYVLMGDGFRAAGNMQMAAKTDAQIIAVLDRKRAKSGLSIDDESNYGAALLRMNRPSEALPVLEDAVSRQPNHARLWVNVATARYQIGNRAGAREAFNRATAISSTFEAVRPDWAK